MTNTMVLYFRCGLDCNEQHRGSGVPLWTGMRHWAIQRFWNPLWTELCYWAEQQLFRSCIVNCTAYWVTQSFWCSVLDCIALLNNTAVLGFHSRLNCIIEQHNVSGVPLLALLLYWTIQRIWSFTVDWTALLSNSGSGVPLWTGLRYWVIAVPVFHCGLDCVME
jgi:hypothetical protein